MCIRAWLELGSVSSLGCLDAPAVLLVGETADASRNPRLETGKTLDNNDLNQVGVQRFYCKQGFGWGAESRGLIKPGLDHCYLRIFWGLSLGSSGLKHLCPEMHAMAKIRQKAGDLNWMPKSGPLESGDFGD